MKHTAMKHTFLIVIMMIMAGTVGLLLSKNAFTSVLDLKPSDDEVQGITYITGGIGKSESNLMKELAKCYQLEIMLVQEPTAIKDSDYKEVYFADIKIKIQDHNLNNVLDIVADGPYILADLAAGKYRITADYNGSVKQQWVTVSSHNHQKVVFWS